jgi:hypothetical protein
MAYLSLLVTSFFWSASLPLFDECPVARVVQGHARALYICEGMDEEQVSRLLGEDGVNFNKLDLIGGTRWISRDYPKNGIMVSFVGNWDDIPRIPRVRAAGPRASYVLSLPYLKALTVWYLWTDLSP